MFVFNLLAVHIDVHVILFQAGAAFVSKSLGLINFNSDPNGAVSDADLVIEAIVENIDVKTKLFAGLDKSAPE